MPLPPLSAENAAFVEKLLKPYEYLTLSPRAENRLRDACIYTLAHLVVRTEKEILSIKNLGRKTLNEIKEILAEEGLSLGMHPQLGGLRNRINEELREKGMPTLDDWNEKQRWYGGSLSRRPSLPSIPPSPPPQGEPVPMDTTPKEGKPLSELVAIAREQLRGRESQIEYELDLFRRIRGAVSMEMGITIQEGKTPPVICRFFQEHPDPTLKQIEEYIEKLEEKKKDIEMAICCRGIRCLDIVISALKVHESYDQPL